jgi:Uma2 family endonuclease
VSGRAEVVVPGRADVTRPEPDLVAFRDFPTGPALVGLRWDDVHPVLVVEIISPDDPEKDLVRNVDLYEQVTSVREYWVIDPRPDPDRPSLRVYRRRGRRRQKPIDVAFGETYAPRLMPDFALVVDPSR